MIDGIFIGFCSFAARFCSAMGGREGVFLKERYLFDSVTSVVEFCGRELIGA